MSAWSDPPDTGDVAGGGQGAQSAPVPAFAVGERVYSGDSPQPGTVLSVDAAEGTLGVDWGEGPITYPIDAPYLRKAWPWE